MRIFRQIGRALAVTFVAAALAAGAESDTDHFIYQQPDPPPTHIPNLPCATPAALAVLNHDMTQWQMDYSKFITEESAYRDAEDAYTRTHAAYDAAEASGDTAAMHATGKAAAEANTELFHEIDAMKSMLKTLHLDQLKWDDALETARKACPPPATGGGRTRNASTYELAVLQEINKARTDPQGYANVLCGGPSAAHAEAVAFLEKQSPLPALVWDGRLGQAAGDHAADDGVHGNAEHVGTDGSKPNTRAQALGVYSSVYAEVISIQQRSACEVVSQLVTDLPGPRHPHRDDLLDPMLKNAGVGCGDNAKYGTMCVVDMSADSVGADD